MLARYQLPRGASMAWAFVARRALSPSTPRAQGAPLRASGVDRSARPSKWLSCQQCEEAPLGLPRTIFNRHPPEVSITEICYQFRVSHIGCSPLLSPKIRTIFATFHKKLLSGLPTLQSTRCRRGGRQVIFISLGDFQPTRCTFGAFDVEIRDPRCRFSGLRRNSSCRRPPTA